MSKFKISMPGLLLAGLYVIPTTYCIIKAFSGNHDVKSNFVLLQIPLALQLAELDSMGLGFLLKGKSLFIGYLTIFPLTIFLFYFIGFYMDNKIIKPHADNSED